MAFDRVARHFASLNPDLPLQRGYARVMAGDHLVRSVAQARNAGGVRLHFADGAVDATVERGASAVPLEKPASPSISPASRSQRKPREERDAGQQDLFS
jgi:exodeoxyribonuclease VII large subunit